MSWKKSELLYIASRIFEKPTQLPEIIQSTILTTIGGFDDDDDIVTWNDIEIAIGIALSERTLGISEEKIIELVKIELDLSQETIDLETPRLIEIEKKREHIQSRREKQEKGRWYNPYA